VVDVALTRPGFAGCLSSAENAPIPTFLPSHVFHSLRERLACTFRARAARFGYCSRRGVCCSVFPRRSDDIAEHRSRRIHGRSQNSGHRTNKSIAKRVGREWFVTLAERLSRLREQAEQLARELDTLEKEAQKKK
jgi:hypothetical protein